MADEFSDLSKVRHVQAGDPVANKPTSQPTRALELRLQTLESLFEAFTSQGEFNRLVIRNVAIKTGESAVAVDDVVYYNANTGLYEKGLAGVTFSNGAYNSNPSALALGICVAVRGNLGDIMIAGYSKWRDINQREGMLESTEDFVPGIPYYLSDDEPGKITRYPPALKIQVFMATEEHFIMLPAYSNADAIEALYRVPMGMRPVGGIRSIPPSYEQQVIVGFDGLERVDSTVDFNVWQSTEQSSVSAIANFGYMVADAKITNPATAPVYVRVMVDVGGNINVISGLTLEELSLSGTYFNQVTGLLPLTAGTHETVRSYTVKASSTDNTELGILYFKFVSDDTSLRRDVIFKFPDSFQGWKMINAPVTPLATATVSGGSVTSIKVLEPSVGYTTPPKVIITGTGTITTVAEAVAVLNAFGSIERVDITNAGAGYASATVSFDTTVAAINLLNGGDTAVITPSITSGEITSVAVTNAGANYTSVPSLVVTDPTGTGAILQAEVANGSISRVTIVSQGSGYTSPKVIVRPSGVGGYIKTTQGIFVASVSAGAVTGVSIVADGVTGLTGGWGYPSVVAVTLTGGGGTGAVVTATVNPTTRAVTGFTVVNPGTGYTSAPTVTVTPADPVAVIDGGSPTTPAAATVVQSGMKVARIDLICAGYGYDAATTIALVGGYYVGGTAATVKPVIEAATGKIIAVDVLSAGSGYFKPPTIVVTDPGGDGNGFDATVVIDTWPNYATVTNEGAGYKGLPTVGIGVPLETIEVEVGGSGYSAAPLVSVAPPELPVAQGGRAATAVARLGGAIRDVVIISAGTGYSGAGVTVTGGGGTGADIRVSVDASGAVSAVDIVNAGHGFTSVPTLAVTGGGTGAVLQCTIEQDDTVVEVVITDPGYGYTRRPDVTIAPPTVGVQAVAQAKLMGEGSATSVSMHGEGGIHLTQTTVAAQGNRLQVFDYGDDLNDTPTSAYTKPTGAVFFYNIKTDTTFKSRWPAIPVSKALMVMNGVELNSTEFNEVTGAVFNPNADVLFSKKTPMWTTFDADGCPWDREYRHYIIDNEADGLDDTIPETGATGQELDWFRFWEHVFKYEVNRNTAQMHINQASRFYQSGRLAALGVLSPLRLIDVVSGTEAKNDGTLMTGQLLLTLDNQVNILGGTKTQIDATIANNIIPIYQNNTGRPVFISSVLLQVIYQLNNVATPSVSDAALVTVGTQEGNYRDIIGTVDPTQVTQQGKSTKLYATNRMKELFPDDRESSPLIMPNQIVYLRVDYPVNSTVIQSQILVATIKGHVF